MQIRKNETQLEHFQAFLNKMAKLDSYVLIKQDTFKKHSEIISLQAIADIDDYHKYSLTLRTHGAYVKIPLGKIVINHIIALHVLLLGQSHEIKTTLIEKHKNLFIDALSDFYLDNYNKYLIDNQKLELMIEKMDGVYLDIMNDFIGRSIAPDYNEEKLKNWIIKYSTIGLEKSELSMNLILKNANENPEKGWLASIIYDYRNLNKNCRISYGQQAEMNLVSRMENAAKNNLAFLQKDEDDIGQVVQDQIAMIWQELRNEQFIQFRKISRSNYGMILQSVLFTFSIIGSLLYYFEFNLIVSTLAMAYLTKFIADIHTTNKNNRTILPQFKLKNDLYNDRESMLALIYKEYTPKPRIIEIAQTNNKESQTVKTYFFQHFVDEANQSSNNAYPKHKGFSQRENSNNKQRKSLSIAPSATQVRANQQVPWKTTTGDNFFPPAQCYQIDCDYKNPIYGYLTQNAYHALTDNVSSKKKESLKNNMSRFFRAARASNDSGIVFFNKQERKKFNAHSKIKPKDKEIGSVRIFGHVMAIGPKGERLIAYDTDDQPKHTKKSN